MAGPLDRVARRVSKKLTRTFGQRAILRSPSSTYTPSTGTVSESSSDRVVWGRVETVRRSDDDGVLRRMTAFTVPADGLYVEAQFRLPEVQDRVVIGADIFGTDTNPGWTGGTEYHVDDIEEEWANQQVYEYRLVLKR